MIQCIPASAGAAMSVALFGLPRPAAVRRAGEVTTALCAVRKDVKGALWMVLDDEREVFVHPAAELTEVEAILEPLILGGVLAAGTITNLRALLDASRGRSVKLFECFPPEIRAMAKPLTQMMEEGLMSEPGGMM